MNKLFDIPTTIWAKFNGPDLVEVEITATKDSRSKIWGIIVRDDFNPGVAQFGIRGDTPTTIILRPYPGYEKSDLVAQMAYAAACLAQVEDFTVLFDDPKGNGPPTIKNLPIVTGFRVDDHTAREFQKLYVSYMAAKTLKNMIGDLGLSMIDYDTIRSWQVAAEEALRRLRFPDAKRKLNFRELSVVTDAVDLVSQCAAEAQVIRQDQAVANDELREQVDVFAAAIKNCGPLPTFVSRYHELLGAVKVEQIIGQDSVDSFPWAKIRTAMKIIRANTPPVPEKK